MGDSALHIYTTIVIFVVTFASKLVVSPHLLFIKKFTNFPLFNLFQAVTKTKLGYDPLEVNPEDMVRFAKEKPQVTCPETFLTSAFCFWK